MKTAISFIIPVRHGGEVLRNTLKVLTEKLASLKESYELILVPNHHPNDLDDGTEVLCQSLSMEFPHTRVIIHRGKVGKGAAIQTGMKAAEGEWIFFTDADLPYETGCIHAALDKLRAGADFVTANRRIRGSRFVCSVEVLPLVYRRHRYGLLFNRFARVLFGIKTLDTQAGFKGFSRRMLSAVIPLHSCNGFLADIEYFLIAKENGFIHQEIPVKFYLYSEKSTVRLFREIRNTLVWFSILFVRKALGKYRYKLGSSENRVTADDWGISPSVNDGVLILAQKNVLGRVSILSESSFVLNRLDELVALKNIQFGLHFDLSLQERKNSMNAFDVTKVFRFIFSPFLNREEKIRTFELLAEKQIQKLKSLGLNISYVDGHQHLHLLPYVAEGVARAMQKHSISIVRNPYWNRLWFSRKFMINILSLYGMRFFSEKSIRAYSCRYPSKKISFQPQKMKTFIQKYRNHEIIVHPSVMDDFESVGCSDPYRGERVKEFAALTTLVEGSSI